MTFFRIKKIRVMAPFSGRTRSGSVPLGILAAGVGLAVTTAALVRMADRLRSVSDSQKRDAATQTSKSSVAVFKQLMQSDAGGLPAVFPDPIIRGPADKSLKLAKNSDLTANTWKLDHTGSNSELTILNFDPRNADFTAPFSGRDHSSATLRSRIAISKVESTSVSSNVSIVDTVEIAVQVQDPVGKSSKLITSKFRMDVPNAPTPTCSIQSDTGGVRMLANGAVMAAQISDQTSGALIGSFDRNNVTPGSTMADSVYARGISLLSRDFSSFPAAIVDRPGPMTIVGEVTGVTGDSSTCSATVNRTTTVLPTPVPRPEPEKISCKLRLVQGALEYYSGRIERRPQLVVKVGDGVALHGMPKVVSLGSGNPGTGSWSLSETGSPGCQDPPCYRGVFNDRAVWQPGSFKVSIKGKDGGVGECRAFNYGAWDGTWRSGPMAYSELHVGSWALAAAEAAKIVKVDNPGLAASNTFVYSAEMVTRLCSLQGLSPYYSSQTGSERRSNYTSCGNNAHWMIRNNKLVKVPACSTQWIGSLICN